MGGVLAGLVLGDAEAEGREVDAGEHRLALPEHDRRREDVRLVDEACPRSAAGRAVNGSYARERSCRNRA